MRTIIIFYEILSREYFACDKIRKILENKFKYKVGVYSIIYQYYDAVKFANKNGIDCVIMPWMRLDENYQYLKPFIDINDKVVICDLSHEQVASDETLITVIPTSENTIKDVIHFCWGEYFKNLLIENGVKEENIYITGNPRLDFKYENKIDKETIAKQFNLDLNKKWILFAEARDWILDVCNYNLRIEAGISVDIEKESFAWNKKCLTQTYNQINNLNDEFFEKFELIYRPHPSCSNPKEIINKNVIITANYSIYDWFEIIDYFISSASTSIFEAESIGMPSVYYDIYDMPKTFKAYGLEEYYQINSLENIDEELFKKAQDYIKGKDIYKKYIGVSEGNNCDKVADVINKLINSENKIIYKKTQINKFNELKSLIKSKIRNFLMTTGFVRLIKSKKWCNLKYKDYPLEKKNKKMYGIRNETGK